ncbi:MAG: helix-turn-helix transcriptional regulator [Candidatus Velthaea sp.]
MIELRSEVVMHAIERSTNRARLGEFLRTRRARFSPEDFGLTPIGRRRTPGLRREEVAQLAGISLAYYTWIEQGRDLNLSDDVLNALARALRFTKAERAHLFTLAGLAVTENAVVAEGATHPALDHLLDNSSNVCALTYDPWFNVLAATPLAAAVFGVRPTGSFDSNLLYRLFSDPAQRRLWVDWEGEARMLVGMFRQSLAKWPASPEGTQLLDGLTRMADFAAIWREYDVRLQPSPDEYFRAEPWVLNHPTAATLRIHRIALGLPTPGQGTLALSSPADPQTCSKFHGLMNLERPNLFLVKA